MSIRPFVVDIPESALEDLRRRLDHTRWPERETVEDWSQGAPLAAVRALVDYWRSTYDWRACERWINETGSCVTEIDGVDIHFLHIRSPHENAVPLVLTHGWPGSILEFRNVIGPLTNPTAHGGTAEDAFHVVIPALPGFGLAGKPSVRGWSVERIARAWGVLMARLGYTRWFAQGGDWGAAVTTQIAAQAIAGCAGVHVNMPIARPRPEDLAKPTPDELRALAALKHYKDWDAGYSKQQSTRPQTIGYSLVDSPVGLAGWIYEKMWAWTDNGGKPEDALSRQSIVDNIMLYWLPGAGASAARLYWESFGSFKEQKITLPVAVSLFPKEIIPAAQKWVERAYPTLVHWGAPERGGHFAAWEQPETFTRELRAGFKSMR
jgi:pimeloyl-ACP methyl ester carboxylesterase